MVFPAALTQAELDTYFPRVRDRLKVDPNEPDPKKQPPVFELGLVLAGTVSAGAYTAGVLDYLVQALDAWQRAKEDGDPLAPPHKLVISTIGGTSGGAINGALLLRTASWGFARGAVKANPFYDTWVNRISLDQLLAPESGPSATTFASALNCSAIEAAAANAIGVTGTPLGSTPDTPRHRAYFANPLRLFMMVGNVTGVPYTIDLLGASGLSHELSAHQDYMRFALDVPGGLSNPPIPRPDEIALSSNPTNSNWPILRNAALATSAFPLAFRARDLSKSWEAVAYKVAVIPGVNEPGQVIQLIPRWTRFPTSTYNDPTTTFANVDGGTFNNEPLDVVRCALAGYGSRNDRQADTADRAVVMIDPFSDAENITALDSSQLLKMVFPILGSLISQARMKPEDIALAYKEDAYSRFLVAPVGPGADGRGVVGADAIASGPLGGFLGFVDRSFVDYDFQLGRWNAQAFITKHLMLPEAADNPIFRSWTAAQRNAYRYIVDGMAYLPLIPLMQSLKNASPTDFTLPWPALKAFPPTLKDKLNGRLDSIYDMVKSSLPWYARALLSIGILSAIKNAITAKALAVIYKALNDHGLCPPPPPS
ncbi:MAG TPA: patatin-like phospholipase family protein [Reyranella sp.]|nr:patatin-like phospholipase family protein [Reyranella sp.]